MKRLVPAIAKVLLPLPVRDALRPYWLYFTRAKEISKVGPVQRWAALQNDEIEFWDGVLDVRNVDPKHWPDLRYVRSDPDLPLQEYLKELLPPSADLKILDVGAGPLTMLGKKWEGRHIHITAIDPNAALYDELLAKHGIDPPCRTRFGYAEDLSAVVPPSSFDLVHARNCIDHSKDPLKAIREMVRVVKPGCYVFLNHSISEGRVQKYQGPHQWNLFPQRDRFYVERPGMRRVDVTEMLRDCADVTVGPSPEGPEWFYAKIRRHPHGFTGT